MIQRIGLYSGTFDPVHEGHMAFALAAKRVGQLSEVVFLPEASPRGKLQVTNLRHRLRMLEEALDPTDGLRLLELPTPRFTIADTLPELRRRFAGAELVLLLGSDVVIGSLAHWPDIERLLAAVPLIVGLRAGDEASAVAATLDALAKKHRLRGRYHIVQAPHSGLTSSRVRRGEHDLTVFSAGAYIKRHGLYRPSR